MGRKPTHDSSNMYSLAQSSIEGMQIGDLRIIDMPADLAFFRKYLSEIGKRTRCKYNTRSIDGQLHIFRVFYSNIYSKETK